VRRESAGCTVVGVGHSRVAVVSDPAGLLSKPNLSPAVRGWSSDPRQLGQIQAPTRPSVNGQTEHDVTVVALSEAFLLWDNCWVHERSPVRINSRLPHLGRSLLRSALPLQPDNDAGVGSPNRLGSGPSHLVFSFRSTGFGFQTLAKASLGSVTSLVRPDPSTY